jgi:tetratricopeptide (TPR) repeat protein
MRQNWDLAVCSAFLAVIFFFPPNSNCFAQGPAPAQAPDANSVVKADSLEVHSRADQTSEVVRTLKKGDSLVLGLEIRSTVHTWCSVKLPGQSARLGYVECLGLERTDHQPGNQPGAGSTANPTGGSRETVGGKTSGPPIHLPLARPAAESTSEYERVKAVVVHDGTLDGPKISEYERAAQGGSSVTMARAAMAHYAAGNFELDHGDSDSAVEQYRAALPFAAKQTSLSFGILMRLAYIHLVRSEFSTALGYLDKAGQLVPGSAAVAQLSGQAYYGLNRLDDAIKEWRTAQRISPNPEVAMSLERAERDQAAEADSHQGETSHFVLRYQGGATPALAGEILGTLEEHFRSLQTALDFTPVEPIGVILYTKQEFRDITLAPSWAGGLNDGRIRVPVEGLNSVTAELSRVLKHELTHSFVYQMSLGRCPTWLNEGLAQWMEGRRSGENAKGLIMAYERKQYIPLERLSGPWNSFPAPVAGYAYAWGLAAVEFIMSRSGPWGISRLFANFNSASSFEAAMGAALQTNYEDLERGTVDYLKQTYGQ